MKHDLEMHAKNPIDAEIQHQARHGYGCWLFDKIMTKLNKYKHYSYDYCCCYATAAATGH